MFTLAHFSDIHLGFEAYAARSSSGFNQRGEDVVRALDRVVTDIIAADPPLVICSGDVAEIPHLPVRYMLAAGREFRRLSDLRPDGTRRQLVVIAGNHDQSKHLRDGCFLDLFRDLPGVHIVTSGYRQVTFGADADPILSSTVVHALPHDSLRDLADLGVAPVPGAVNILTTHGVAESTELFKRAVGREYIIPTDLLVQDWEYVALGHWHKQGPVFPLGFQSERSRIWYAGSVETIGFSDARHGKLVSRGWLLVDVDQGSHPKVRPQTHPVRTVATLPDVDAAALNPEQILAAVAANLDPSLHGAVVRQRVLNVPRDLWTLTDTASLRPRTEGFVHYQLEPVFRRDQPTDADGEQPRGLAAVASLLRTRCQEIIPEADRDPVLGLAVELLGQVAVLSEQDGEESTPAGAVRSAGPQAAPERPGSVVAPPLVAGNDDAPTPASVSPTESAASIAGSGTPVVEADDSPASLPVSIPEPPSDPKAAFDAVLAEFEGLDIADGDPR